MAKILVTKGKLLGAGLRMSYDELSEATESMSGPGSICELSSIVGVAASRRESLSSAWTKLCAISAKSTVGDLYEIASRPTSTIFVT